MLRDYVAPVFGFQDQQIFDALVVFDCWTRRADQYIDFLALRETIAPLFHDEGRPAIEPILFLKLELLMYHDRLSDSQVYARAKTDLAYRRFLGLGRDDHLPDVSSLGRFRARLGSEGHRKLFDGLLKQARSRGLVKDRLRIKDATHVLADIAIPAGIEIVASARNKLLSAAEPFDLERVTGERVRVETIRTSTDTGNADARLLARADHLCDILCWVDEWLATGNDLFKSDSGTPSKQWNQLQTAAEIARKVLSGHDTPSRPGKIRSTVDPDARRGRHGEFYDGYMVDVLIDADSEMFTAINVLPADGNETADTLTLINHEQQIHGNEIENLSIDGAGYSGPLVRELESRGVSVFVPPKTQTNGGKFTSDQFELSDDESHVTCPAGQLSQYKQRDESKHSTSFRFKKEACHACELKSQCINPDQKFGRSVRKNDFQPEYDLIGQRAESPEYADVKKMHPRVERRLGMIVVRHGGRRARYRRQDRVLVQNLMIGTIANVKRMIKLLDDKLPAFGAARLATIGC
jgi:transposase